MADPFSIVAGTIGIVDICIRLAKSIRKLQKDISGIEDELDAIIQDTDGLREICAIVETTYTTRSRNPPSESAEQEKVATNLWVHLGKTLRNCLGVLNKLDEIVGVVYGNSTGSTAGRVGMIMRKKKYEREFHDCRLQMATFQNALHLVLTTITFHDLGAASDSNNRSLKALSHDIQNLDDSIQSHIVTLQQSTQTVGSDRHDGQTLVALRELRESVNFAAVAMKSVPVNHHFDVPQSVSSIFTGRETLLKELQEKFIPDRKSFRDEEQRRTIIHGLGGSGKTQFCCKFAQDNRDSFWGVFWIDASTPERAKETLGAIAATAGLEKNVDSALHWLSNLEHKWLLIIDNADDDDVPLEKYFPKGNRGNILVTTRNPAYKFYGTGKYPQYYEFRGLELEESTRLLLRASNRPSPWDSTCEGFASAITKALGHLALAIIHAGAAIRDKLCNLQDYLEYFTRSRQRIRRAKLTEKSSSSEATVYATWEICYHRLEQRGTEASLDAIELLNVLAFLHWETIPDEIFTRALRHAETETPSEPDTEQHPALDTYSWTTLTNRLRAVPGGLLALLFQHRSPPALPRIIRDAYQSGSVDDAKYRVRHAFKELVQMSLIIHNDHSDTYAMHPLVHIWARERPRMRLADQAFWADATGRVLAASILLPPLGTRAADEKYHIGLLPHVEHVQACRDQIAVAILLKRRSVYPIRSWFTQLLPDLIPDPDNVRMYAKFSLVYAKCGRWESAEKLLKEVTNFLCRYLGPEHKRSRQASLLLATVYWNLGRPADAAKLQCSVLETSASHLGPSHPDTLKAMSELGRTRWQQGEYTRARKLQEKVLHELRQRLPHDHIDTLEAMDNLGLTMHKFWERHHFEEAFRLHSEAAEGMAKVHGADHERTLMAKENLCRVAALLGGSHIKSRSGVMAEVLETRRAKLGKEHPYTLLAMVNMAIVLCAMDRPDEAEELVRQGLPVADRNLGRDHIGTLFGRHTLACILVQRGHYAEAEELLVHVTDSQKHMNSHRGDYHPDRLGALIELARCSFLLGKIHRAIDICDEAIHGFDCISVDPHPLATNLRTTRDRMDRLRQSGLSDQYHNNPSHRHDVTFPFVLFRASHDTC